MISREEVEHIARLARLRFSDDESERIQHDLSQILDYVRTLGELDLSGLAPTAHAVEVKNVLRPDEPRPCLERGSALASAPAVEDGQFVVPRIG